MHQQTKHDYFILSFLAYQTFLAQGALGIPTPNATQLFNHFWSIFVTQIILPTALSIGHCRLNEAILVVHCRIDVLNQGDQIPLSLTAYRRQIAQFPEYLTSSKHSIQDAPTSCRSGGIRYSPLPKDSTLCSSAKHFHPLSHSAIFLFTSAAGSRPSCTVTAVYTNSLGLGPSVTAPQLKGCYYILFCT
jgi:hypothetical protein